MKRLAIVIAVFLASIAWGDSLVSVQNFQKVTGTGSQNVTDSGTFGGENPKGVIVLGTYTTNLGTPTAHAHMLFGMTDDTDSTGDMMYFNQEDAVAAAVDSRSVWEITDRAYVIFDEGTNTIIDQINPFNDIADGFSMTHQTNADTQEYITLSMFGGADLQVEQVTFVASATTVGNTITVTGVGFTPEACIIRFIDSASGGLDKGMFNIGIAINDGSETQRLMYYDEDAGIVGAEPRAQIFTNRVSAFGNAGSITSELELTAFNSDGFVLTVRGATTNVRDVNAICFESTDWDFNLTDFDIPTSGNMSIATGDIPEFYLGLWSQLGAVDSLIQTDKAGAWGWIVSDDTNTYSHSISNEDTADPTNTNSLAESGVAILDDAGAEDITGTLDLSETDGFTATLSNWPAVLSKGFALTMGVSAGVAVQRRRHE